MVSHITTNKCKEKQLILPNRMVKGKRRTDRGPQTRSSASSLNCASAYDSKESSECSVEPTQEASPLKGGKAGAVLMNGTKGSRGSSKKRDMDVSSYFSPSRSPPTADDADTATTAATTTDQQHNQTMKSARLARGNSVDSQILDQQQKHHHYLHSHNTVSSPVKYFPALGDATEDGDSDDCVVIGEKHYTSPSANTSFISKPYIIPVTATTPAPHAAGTTTFAAIHTPISITNNTPSNHTPNALTPRTPATSHTPNTPSTLHKIQALEENLALELPLSLSNDLYNLSFLAGADAVGGLEVSPTQRLRCGQGGRGKGRPPKGRKRLNIETIDYTKACEPDAETQPMLDTKTMMKDTHPPVTIIDLLDDEEGSDESSEASSPVKHNGVLESLHSETSSLISSCDKIKNEGAFVPPSNKVKSENDSLRSTCDKIKIQNGVVVPIVTKLIQSINKSNSVEVPTVTTKGATTRKLRGANLNNNSNKNNSKNADNSNRSIAKNAVGDTKDTQMTDYFPIRRSERKPKSTVMYERQMDIENKILDGSEDGLTIEEFGAKGRGVVTTRFFRKGEFVVEYVGDLLDVKDAKTREEKYALDATKGCYMYYFTFNNVQYCLDGTEETGLLGRLVNHSRTASNLITKAVSVKGEPHLVLLAKRDMQPSTELLYDYGDRSKESLTNHPWLAY